MIMTNKNAIVILAYFFYLPNANANVQNETVLLIIENRTTQQNTSEGATKESLLFGCLNLIVTTFFIATLAVYFLLPKLRSINGVTVMCLLVSMTIQYIFHAILNLVPAMPSGLCSTLAISLHFAYIATFSWLNVWFFIFLRMLRSTRPPTNTLDRQFFYYSVYGWGIPLVFVAVGQSQQRMSDDIKLGLASKLYCSFNHKSKGPLIAYLYGPMFATIVGNVFMFFWAAFKFYRRSMEFESDVKNMENSLGTYVFRKNHSRIKVNLYLFLLMGVPWSTEMITFMADSSFKSSLFTDIFNILLPPFIFVIFICKPTVCELLKVKYP